MFVGVTQQSAESVTTIKYDDLPQEVVEKIELMLLDSIGCALAAYYGHSPSPAWEMPATFNDPGIRALMHKVKVELHPQASELMTSLIKVGKLPNFWNTIVEITAGGRKFSTEVSVRKGGAENPMTTAELVEKFRVNAAYSRLKSSKTEQIVQMIDQLDKVTDVTELTRLTTVI